eukprot:6183550-Pleurochrysis_carterae.AAC.1
MGCESGRRTGRSAEGVSDSCRTKDLHLMKSSVEYLGSRYYFQTGRAKSNLGSQRHWRQLISAIIPEWREANE